MQKYRVCIHLYVQHDMMVRIKTAGRISFQVQDRNHKAVQKAVQ